MSGEQLYFKVHTKLLRAHSWLECAIISQWIPYKFQTVGPGQKKLGFQIFFGEHVEWRLAQIIDDGDTGTQCGSSLWDIGARCAWRQRLILSRRTFTGPYEQRVLYVAFGDAAGQLYFLAR